MFLNRSLIASRLAQLILIIVGVLLTFVYLNWFDNPPYPALVPVAFWFFLLSYFSVLWLLRTLARGSARWQASLALGIAAILTLSIYLAGQIGEQQRQADIRERHLSD